MIKSNSLAVRCIFKVAVWQWWFAGVARADWATSNPRGWAMVTVYFMVMPVSLGLNFVALLITAMFRRPTTAGSSGQCVPTIGEGRRLLIHLGSWLGTWLIVLFLLEGVELEPSAVIVTLGVAIALLAPHLLVASANRKLAHLTQEQIHSKGENQ